MGFPTWGDLTYIHIYIYIFEVGIGGKNWWIPWCFSFSIQRGPPLFRSPMPWVTCKCPLKECDACNEECIFGTAMNMISWQAVAVAVPAAR